MLLNAKAVTVCLLQSLLILIDKQKNKTHKLIEYDQGPDNSKSSGNKLSYKFSNGFSNLDIKLLQNDNSIKNIELNCKTNGFLTAPTNNALKFTLNLNSKMITKYGYWSFINGQQIDHSDYKSSLNGAPQNYAFCHLRAEHAFMNLKSTTANTTESKVVMKLSTLTTNYDDMKTPLRPFKALSVLRNRSFGKADSAWVILQCGLIKDRGDVFYTDDEYAAILKEAMPAGTIEF